MPRSLFRWPNVATRGDALHVGLEPAERLEPPDGHEEIGVGSDRRRGPPAQLQLGQAERLEERGHLSLEGHATRQRRDDPDDRSADLALHLGLEEAPQGVEDDAVAREPAGLDHRVDGGERRVARVAHLARGCEPPEAQVRALARGTRDEGETKAVPDSFISAAIRCICASESASASSTTAAGFPAKGRLVNALIWTMGIQMLMAGRSRASRA